MFSIDDIPTRLLIIDDEPDLRDVLTSFLETTYECDEADSAEAGLRLIRQQTYAVVITDINLTGMSGLDLIPLIKEQAPDTVVLVISGQKGIENAIAALRNGAFDYIVKPFDLHHVDTAVHRAIEHYKLQVIKRRYDYHLEELVAERTAQLDEAFDEIENSYRSTLKALVQALETRDFETHGHSERVVTFSLRLGYELGLSSDKLRALEFGALLHDIGKIGVPDAILRKPAKLTDEEWKKMRLHPIYGQQILRNISFLEGAAFVVGQHHEKWDGSGYPLGLKGEEIDISARIFSVVDAFDAIISDRVYRAGKSYEEAATEIEAHTGKQFDPEVVSAFHRVPKDDWETLRRRSTQRKPERFSFQDFVAEVMNERREAPEKVMEERSFEPVTELP